MYTLFLNETDIQKYLKTIANRETYQKIDDLHKLFIQIVSNSLHSAFQTIESMNTTDYDRWYLSFLENYYCTCDDLYHEFLIKCFSTNNSLLVMPYYFPLIRSQRALNNEYSNIFTDNNKDCSLQFFHQILTKYYTKISLEHILHVLQNLETMLTQGYVQLDNLRDYLNENLKTPKLIHNFKTDIFSKHTHKFSFHIDSCITKVLQKYDEDIQALCATFSLDNCRKTTIKECNILLLNLQSKVKSDFDNISICRDINVEGVDIFKNCDSNLVRSINKNISHAIHSDFSRNPFLYKSTDLYNYGANRDIYKTLELIDCSNSFPSCYASFPDIERFIYLHPNNQSDIFSFMYSHGRKTPTEIDINKHQLFCNKVIESSLNGFSTLEHYLQAWHIDHTFRITFSRDALKVLSADYWRANNNTSAFNLISKLCSTYEESGLQFYTRGHTHTLTTPTEIQLKKENLLIFLLTELQHGPDQKLKEFSNKVLTLYSKYKTPNSHHLLYDIYLKELHLLRSTTKTTYRVLEDINEYLDIFSNLKQKYDNSPDDFTGNTFEPFIVYFLLFGFNEKSSFALNMNDIFSKIATSLKTAEKTFYAILFEKFKDDKNKLYAIVSDEAKQSLSAINTFLALPLKNYYLYNNYSELRPTYEASNCVTQILNKYFFTT